MDTDQGNASEKREELLTGCVGRACMRETPVAYAPAGANLGSGGCGRLFIEVLTSEMELLDITFRLKRKLGVTVSKRDRKSLMEGRTPPDLSIGALQALVCKKIVEAGRWEEFEPKLDGDFPCRICGYNLRGLRRDGRCPECGTGVEAYDQIWAILCQVVTDATGVEERQIGRTSMLYRDLVQ